VLARGTVEEKLLWAFSLYDTDGDGIITREELLDVVSGIYDLMGKYAEPVITPDTAREHVDRVFQVRFYGENQSINQSIDKIHIALLTKYGRRRR